MLFLKEQPKLLTEPGRVAPDLGGGRYDPKSKYNGCMVTLEYNGTQDNSYTRKLMEKYPLENE